MVDFAKIGIKDDSHFTTLKMAKILLILFPNYYHYENFQDPTHFDVFITIGWINWYVLIIFSNKLIKIFQGSPLHDYLDQLDLLESEDDNSDFYVESTDCGDINKSGFFCGASFKVSNIYI